MKETINKSTPPISINRLRPAKPRRMTGFTIVELLVVIVVIGILTAITIVAYSGIQNRASFASAQSGVTNIIKKLELFKVDSDKYPVSITDCPTPAATNLCISAGPGTTYRYVANNSSNPQGYEIGSLGTSQFYYSSNIESYVGYEFMVYSDLAPMIDKYGLVSYKLTFDIKSANISSQNTMQVYMQNGNGARYDASASVPVTTSYTAQSVTFNPSVSNLSFSQSMLAFYGTYGTGNYPSVRNVRFQRS